MASELRTWLEKDHRQIEGLLAMATAAADFDVGSFSRARARLMRHIAIEEKIVFRAMRDVDGLEAEHPAVLAALRQARIDHAAITTLLVPRPDAALVAELIALLGPHNVLEEADDGLYAQCDALLGAACERLLFEVKAYPAVAVRDYVDDDTMIRTAADARRKAERLRSTMSW